MIEQNEVQQIGNIFTYYLNYKGIEIEIIKKIIDCVKKISKKSCQKIFQIVIFR